MIYIDKNKILTSGDVERIISSLHLDGMILSSRNIVIKPNFTYVSSLEKNQHVITDLPLLNAVVKAILKMNPQATVYIAESDSGSHQYAYMKFEKLNLPDSLELSDGDRHKVHILNLSTDRMVRIVDERFLYFQKNRPLWISETMASADFVVSLANLKCHQDVIFSGACKNMFGILPGLEKWRLHPRIHQVIHDLVLICPPKMSLIDGFCGMEGRGPIMGNPRNTGFRLWSNSSLEADLSACHAVSLPIPRYLKLLQKNQPDFTTNVCEMVKIRFCKPPNRGRVLAGVGNYLILFGEWMVGFGFRISRCRDWYVLIKDLMSKDKN